MKKFFKSFGYAFKGIYAAVKAEQNLRFDIVCGIYVFLFSLFYDFTAVEYALISMAVFGVMALEMLNSSIERVMDKPTPTKAYLAGEVKDVAAGAVLVFGVGAFICGAVLFFDVTVIKSIFSFFINKPLMALLFAVSLVCGCMFIFKKEA